MASIIPNLSDVKELQPVPAGEYDLCLNSVKHVTYDSGASCINMAFEIVGEDDAETLWHKLWLPTKGEAESTTNNKLRTLKKFMEDCDIPTDEALDDLTCFDNLTLTANVGVEYDDYNSKDINTLKSVKKV